MSKLLYEKTPLLDELLNLPINNGDQPTIIKFDDHETKSNEEPKQELKATAKSSDDYFNYSEAALSYRFQDYYQIEPEHTRCFEEQGDDNSLFLAISRALLYKLHFENKNYVHLFRHVYFSEMNFNIHSDVQIQKLIRKKLCIYWLKKIQNGNFITNNSAVNYTK